MPNFRATDQPVYFAVIEGGVVVASGTTEVGGLTVTGEDKTFPYSPSEYVFLGKVVGRGGEYNRLPTLGNLVEAGLIYSFGNDMVICRQTHVRIARPPFLTPDLFVAHNPNPNAGDVLTWIANENVLVGTRRLYNAIEYTCLQAHITQADWTPPQVPALWQVV